MKDCRIIHIYTHRWCHKRLVLKLLYWQCISTARKLFIKRHSSYTTIIQYASMVYSKR